ncbi:MAG: nucleoside deaminase [Gammaproteobacteria bacterium]|nr:MAG: nucleoside deaminase [Gammaproteobacteria bacterium]
MTEQQAIDRLHTPHMRAAIAVARRGLAAGEPPVGACLVRQGEVIATLNNAVISELDATAHAEVRVIREACRHLRTLELRDCTLYATVEPCVMCLSACHYAGVDRVIFGASLADMHAVTGAELTITRDDLVRGGLRVAVSGQCLADECRALLDDWARGLQTR